MDFNLFSILKENIVLLTIIVIFAIICRRIYHFLFPDQIIFDNEKWTRFIPRSVLETQGDIIPERQRGWVPLIGSNKVKVNQIVGIQALRMDLVVFRSSSGKVHVLDAYCPHMGTYLPVGGKVVGECVRCPFHGWTFNGEGECTHVPGLDGTSLPRANIKTWITCEINGLIMIWFDTNDSLPTWMPTEAKELVELKHIEVIHKCFGHFWETPLNIGDYKHMDFVHTTIAISGFDPVSILRQNLLARIVQKVITVVSKVDLKFDQIIKHRYTVLINVEIILFGKQIDTGISISVIGEGPYFMYFTFNGLLVEWAKLRSIVYYRPISGRKYLTTMIHYSKADILSRLVNMIVARYEGAQFVRDAIIWSNKVVFKRPHFAKYDGKLKEMFNFLNSQQNN